MVADAIPASRDSNLFLSSSTPDSRWRERWQITGKVLVVALVVAALVLATYFSAGLALPLIAKGAFSVEALASSVAMFSFGIAALAAPVFAFVYRMHQATDENIKDTLKFLRSLFLLVLIASIAFTYCHLRAHRIF